MSSEIAIDKYNQRFKQIDYSHLESVISQIPRGNKERFLIKIGDRYKSIQSSDINAFYIRERCNFILTNTGRSYPIDYSLDQVEQQIDSKMFFRINRNTIVNFNAISDIFAYSSSRLKIKMKGWIGEEDLVASRERVSEFKNWMDR